MWVALREDIWIFPFLNKSRLLVAMYSFIAFSLFCRGWISVIFSNSDHFFQIRCFKIYIGKEAPWLPCLWCVMFSLVWNQIIQKAILLNYFEFWSHGCSRNGFKTCGTTVLIYSTLNKEQQKTVSKAFYSLPKALKMRWLISSAYHKGINGVYLSTKCGPKI